MKQSFWTSHTVHINLSRNDCCPKETNKISTYWSNKSGVAPSHITSPSVSSRWTSCYIQLFIKFSTKISNFDINLYRESSLIKSIVNIINNEKKKHVRNLYVFQEITIHFIKTWISKMLFHTLKACWITFIG